MVRIQALACFSRARACIANDGIATEGMLLSINGYCISISILPLFDMTIEPNVCSCIGKYAELWLTVWQVGGLPSECDSRYQTGAQGEWSRILNSLENP